MTVQKLTRYQGCKPTIICGRKVWIAERGGYGSSVKEFWLHLDPFRPADLYLKGSSLTEGDAASNADYLEHLCRDVISKARPVSTKIESLWDSDRAESDAYDTYLASQIA